MADVPANPALSAILHELRWVVRPERFVVVGLHPRERQLAARLMPFDQSPFAQLIVEPGIITMVLPENDWRSISPAFPRARTQRGYRVISFENDLPDGLVGFLALFTAELARAHVSLLAVCGYTRDHILVRDEQLDAARAAITRVLEHPYYQPS